MGWQMLECFLRLYGVEQALVWRFVVVAEHLQLSVFGAGRTGSVILLGCRKVGLVLLALIALALIQPVEVGQPLHQLSITITSVPAATLSPIDTRIRLTTPAHGAGNSIAVF